MSRNKRRAAQPGFFDVADRIALLGKNNQPLVRIAKLVDWEAFRADLSQVHKKERKSPAGAKPIDEVLMFKILVLQHLNNLSDEAVEYHIGDRFSCMQFLGLQLEDRVPDARTIWLFREHLARLQLVEVLFARFHAQVAALGYSAKSGQVVDATFVEVSRQRNSREQNAQIKAGEVPADWRKPEAKAKRRQQDADARWAKMHSEIHYGYKNHVGADADTKLIRAFEVTDAAVHDSKVFEVLLDVPTDRKAGATNAVVADALEISCSPAVTEVAEGPEVAEVPGGPQPAQAAEASESKATAVGTQVLVFADSAYRSAEKEAWLTEHGMVSQICEKGTPHRLLTPEQKARYREKSKVRARVEHIFGA